MLDNVFYFAIMLTTSIEMKPCRRKHKVYTRDAYKSHKWIYEFFLHLKFANTLQVTDGVVCVLTTQVSKFSGINLFPTRHTNRPAFLSTEKESKKAEHIIKQIYNYKGFYNDFRK